MKNRTLAAVGVFLVTLVLALSANSDLAQAKGHDDSVKPVKQGKPAKEVKPPKDVNPPKDVKPVKQAKPVKPAKEVKPNPKPKPAPPVKEVKPNPKPKPAPPVKPAKPVKAVPVFAVRDRDAINVYYVKHPGDKHFSKLPPGLEKQLQRNGTLPPGLRSRFRPFPVALERELIPLPYGYRRGFVDDYVVVYRTGTYLITDSYWYQVR